MPHRTARLAGVAMIGFLATASPARGALFGAQADTGQIVEIDPVTGTIVRGFAAPDSSFGQVGLSAAENGAVLIWRNSSGAATQDMITRIDPITGSVLSLHTPLSSFGAEVHGLTSQRIGETDYLVSAGPS